MATALPAAYFECMEELDRASDALQADPELSFARPLKAPFPWFGGKSRAEKIVWERFGEVPNYVEPFAGSLAVLLRRESRANLETVNDLDGYLVNFWRAVKADPGAVARWADSPVLELDLHARHRWLVSTGKERVERLRVDPDYYDAQVAGWWVWGISLWIGSGWCYKPEWSGRVSAAASPRGINGSEYRQHPDLSGRRGINARNRVRGYYDNNHSRPDVHPTGIHASNRPSRRTENPSQQGKRPIIATTRDIHGRELWQQITTLTRCGTMPLSLWAALTRRGLSLLASEPS